jgi:UDP-glucose 4-epimerase
MTKSKVLVTGGAGYIGSHAVLACLAAGHEVVVVDNLSTGVRAHLPEACALIQGDVGNVAMMAEVIDSHNVHAILHFAGSIVVPESIADPYLYYENNTGKTLRLANLAQDKGIKAFIFSSTAVVYAMDNEGPLSENSLKAPISPYGWSKLMSEQMLADMSLAHGLPVGVLRYFNVAGADPQGRTGQSTPNATHLIKVACQVITGQRDVLPVFGQDYPTPDGTCIRDYIHVSDLADAHVILLEHLLAGGANITANCGYGQGASVMDVIGALERHINQKLPVDLRGRRPGDCPTLVADSSHLKSLLDWQPKYDNLDVIVADALAWERKVAARASRAKSETNFRGT